MSLSVYTGPMFSGKTTCLIHEITFFCDLLKSSALIINHGFDTRDDGNIVSSHSSSYKGLSDKIDVIQVLNLSTLNISNYNIIGIDEACFFNDLFVTVNKWLSLGKYVVCAGLDGDYKMEKFGQISDLLHISNKFIKLTAICSVCVEELIARDEVITPDNIVPASFTQRKTDNQSIVDIGGSEKYRSVCRKHHKNQK